MNVDVICILTCSTKWEVIMTHNDSSKQQQMTDELSPGKKFILIFLLCVMALGVLVIVLKIFGIL